MLGSVSWFWLSRPPASFCRLFSSGVVLFLRFVVLVGTWRYCIFAIVLRLRCSLISSCLRFCCCPDFPMVFVLVHAPVDVSLSESGYFFRFWCVGPVMCSGRSDFPRYVLTSLISSAVVGPCAPSELSVGIDRGDFFGFSRISGVFSFLYRSVLIHFLSVSSVFRFRRISALRFPFCCANSMCVGNLSCEQ